MAIDSGAQPALASSPGAARLSGAGMRPQFMRRQIELREAEVKAWRALSASTNFPKEALAA
ncbi:hypothetical protein [Polaromonas aquatica]|uniref:hypothetical protein n=1 Tax=Polaromonas aquatica TaxID=332657 RepID=UPI003D65C4A1